VAYHGLLAARRRDLHAAVVAAIERMHADGLVEHVERLAHHARQGEVWDRAVRYLRQAGSKAFMRAANREAATSFEQALEALGRLRQTPDTIAESLDIRFDLRTALTPLGEWTRMGSLLDEAERLAEAAGDPRRLARALTYKVIQLVLVGDVAAGLQAGRRALAIGEAQADTAIQVSANAYLGLACRVHGEYAAAVRHCEAAIRLIPDDQPQGRFGQGTIQAAFARSHLANALGSLGRFAEAFGRIREALAIAEEARHDYSSLGPLLALGTLKLDQGDFFGALAPLERGLDLCRTREAPLPLPDFTWALGAAYHATGRRTEGVTLMEDAARRVAERGVTWHWWASRVGALGDAYLVDGRHADALRTAREGLAAARHLGERGAEGHLLRLMGDLAAHPDGLEAGTAEAHYRQAQALAQELGLRPLLARCHFGLGALYRRAGKRPEAREHTTTAGTMFGEMDMRYWREQAEMATDELACGGPV
jgi:tetratricopeptide (TPR) repeat protein